MSDDRTRILVSALLASERSRLDLQAVMGRGVGGRVPIRETQRLAPGIVRDAALVVLADAGLPLEARDVHSGVNAILGHEVPRSSAKGWLYEHATKRGELVIRVSTGTYTLGSAASQDMIERARSRVRRENRLYAAGTRQCDG